MSFAHKGLEKSKVASSKFTTLNPNAAEFVPSALRSTHETKGADSSRVDSAQTSGKVILGRSESSISNNSDDEHQYLCRQLPDDITPDFKAMGEDEVPSLGHRSLAGLSIHEPTSFSVSVHERFGTRHGRTTINTNDLLLSGNMGYSGSDQSPSARFASVTNSWGKQFINGGQQFTRGMRRMEEQHYNGESSANFLNNMLDDQAVKEHTAIEQVEFLSSQFPSFSSESLAEMHYANGCDLNVTIEMLSQLELQGDGGLSKNLYSKSVSAPSLSKLDFQSLSVAEARSGLSNYTGDFHQVPEPYRSTSSVFRGSTDYVSTARKNSSLDSSNWKPGRNGNPDGIISSSRSAQLIANPSYNGHGKLLYGNKSPSLDASWTAPICLETGEAVANMYSESMEEARDLARLRDACLEQASQAYLIGNKALARELSEKGQFYNMQMKAAQLKDGGPIYHKRDPISYELQGYNRGGQDRVIDLHGLHVSDALHVLKHELNILKSTVRSSGQQLQATILLVTGHHTSGTRVSPRLPMAVEQFLLDEGLPYTQSQPGLLHVVIY
ncbi:polyadenylate-binding protein-interacting protein 7-like isoform X1 [Asparagus officinalis]|nr:polyadenylate-binding protein-interacting protein 7-like isoform X1 [Asparagus officinalis]